MLEQRGFGSALALALALHAGAFAWVASAPDAPRARGGSERPALVIRQVTLRMEKAAVPAQAPPQATPQAAAPAQPAIAQVAPSVPAPAAAARPQPAADTAPAAEISQPSPEPEYLPRSRLTTPPRPVAQVQVPFPPEVKGLVDLRVQVALFIDSSGTVRRVRLDTGGVPAAFVQAIHDAFLSARFTPGEVESQPVPSMIRLEVEFGTGAPR